MTYSKVSNVLNDNRQCCQPAPGVKHVETSTPKRSIDRVRRQALGSAVHVFMIWDHLRFVEGDEIVDAGIHCKRGGLYRG